MIARIEGKLTRLETDSALVQVGAIGYEVMLPSYCIGALADRIGTDIVLCTMEYYEGSPGGGNLIPRLVGFLSLEERAFFEEFTSVKGIGIKKGLKALCMPVGTIASAIENGDEKLLKTLPSVGGRLAQQIIAELKGKLKTFAADVTAASPQGVAFRPYQAEALEILIAWGEKRSEAIELIELTCKKHPDIKTAEALVPLVYRVKQGVEV